MSQTKILNLLDLHGHLLFNLRNVSAETIFLGKLSFLIPVQTKVCSFISLTFLLSDVNPQTSFKASLSLNRDNADTSCKLCNNNSSQCWMVKFGFTDSQTDRTYVQYCSVIQYNNTIHMYIIQGTTKHPRS